MKEELSKPEMAYWGDDELEDKGYKTLMEIAFYVFVAICIIDLPALIIGAIFGGIGWVTNRMLVLIDLPERIFEYFFILPEWARKDN